MSKPSLSDGLSTQAAIGLPLAWAGCSALIAGILALSLAMATHQEKPWTWAGVTFGVVLAAGWIFGLTWWAGLVRTIIGGDLPAPAPSSYESDTAFKVQVDHGGDPNYLWVDNLAIPGNPDTITRMARMVASGADFTLAALGGRGKAMTRSEFEAARDYLAAHGYGYKATSGQNSTTLLNAAGRSLMRKIAERSLSEEAPPPTAHGYTPGLRIYSMNADAHTHTQKGRR